MRTNLGCHLNNNLPKLWQGKERKKGDTVPLGINCKLQLWMYQCYWASHATHSSYVYDAKNLNMDWTKEEVPGTTYRLSDNGWIDMKLFKQWFQCHIFRHAGTSRPLLLLLDAHSSHYNIKAISLARENDIIIFTLIQHTTHELQRLGTAVFGLLKKNWNKECHMYVQSHPGRIIIKYHFNEVFSKAWLRNMMPANIIKIYGIYPFNPKAVLDHDPTSDESKEDDSVPTADKIRLHGREETTWFSNNFYCRRRDIFHQAV